METEIRRKGKQKDGESLCTAAYAIGGEYTRTTHRPQGCRMAAPGGLAPLRKTEAQGENTRVVIQLTPRRDGVRVVQGAHRWLGGG
jgi:hypothetical protein